MLSSIAYLKVAPQSHRPIRSGEAAGALFPSRKESWIMAFMATAQGSRAAGDSKRPSLVLVAVLLAVLLVGAHLRFRHLGVRSLWFDEFCTWHVSQLNLPDSLRWEPELTIPPLYQLTLRAATESPHAAEWLLRLPAAVCGVLVILATYWLGTEMSGRFTGAALAALFACNVLQIEYSREARPYTMLVLGSTLSVTIWYRLVMRDRWWCFCAYIVVTVLAFHAHYLAGLTILAQFAWWSCLRLKHRANCRALKPVLALLIVGVLCTPMIIRFVCSRASVSQAINWIEPPSFHSALAILRQISFGGPWIVLLLAPSIILWLVVAARGRDVFSHFRVSGNILGARKDPCGLLLLWLLCAWSGLWAVSWLGQPAMVTRYALPAAVPALLLPLVVGHRIDRRVPLLVTLVLLLWTAPQWIGHGLEVDQGFRELTQYVQKHVDPESEAAVLTFDDALSEDWKDVERLALAYYPLEDRPIYELAVSRVNARSEPSILQDPRALYLIVFRADPFRMIEAAGRTVAPIQHQGTSYSRLLFAPYRLIRVAPLAP
jgi:hypothetical protein